MQLTHATVEQNLGGDIIAFIMKPHLTLALQNKNSDMNI